MNAEALERYLGGSRGAEPGLVDLVLDIAIAQGAAAWTGLVPLCQERHKAHLAKLLGIGKIFPEQSWIFSTVRCRAIVHPPPLISTSRRVVIYLYCVSCLQAPA